MLLLWQMQWMWLRAHRTTCSSLSCRTTFWPRIYCRVIGTCTSSTNREPSNGRTVARSYTARSRSPMLMCVLTTHKLGCHYIYIYIYIYTHTFQRDTQCSSTDCLLMHRCQLYTFQTVTVHPQGLLPFFFLRCCMCRLWYVLICPAGTTFEEEVKFVWSSSIILNFSLVDNYQRFAATCCLHIQNCASFNLKQQAAGSSQKLLIIYQITWNG